MPHLSVSLLGPIKVALDGQAITRFESNKVKALLAYLATEADQPHHRSVLSGLLWPDRPDRAARNNLRNALSLLRRFIGDHRATPPFLQIVGETIQFNCTSHCWLDVKAFTDLLEADPAVCPQLEGAIALYRGDFLEGFSLKDSPPFEDWALLVRERLRRQALTALSHLAEHHEARCDYERARSYAWRQVALEPWQEEAHRHLMRLLALNGQRSVALAQYETCCRLLREELGVEPAPETTRLYERIRGGLETPVAPSSPSHNLPAQLIPLVGREAELAEIAALLRDPACRLLTLVGPGGSGKTRLAIEAARGQLDRFPHGVCLCSLALLHSPEAIVPTLAQALGLSFRREGDPRQQLLDYLREKRLLLLLDNFEHLLAPPETGQEDGVQFLTEILEMAPGVEILATSRARLNARGEALYPVGGMDFPADGMDFPADGMDFPADGMDLPEPASLDARDTERLERSSAVQLFVQSARRVQPGFEPTPDALAAIARVCHLVQGMPLGILLAAGWLGVLSPAEIATEAARSIDFLETDWRAVPERQRSMRAVFDHSWNLLSEREQELLAGLSVFEGGFIREAAQQVTGASLRDLMALANRSLLHRPSFPSATLRTGSSTAEASALRTAGRYGMHELLKRYAAERLASSLGAERAARERHCAYYTSALEQWSIDLRGPRQQTALAEIEADLDNARAAWDWAVEQRDVTGLDRALEGLCCFYQRRGRYQEGQVLCRWAAEKLQAGPAGDGLRVLARLLAWRGAFGRIVGAVKGAWELLQESLGLLGRIDCGDHDARQEKAFALLEMGRIAHALGNHKEARRLCERSLSLHRALDDRWGTAEALEALSREVYLLGAHDEAKRLLEESLVIRRALDDRVGVTQSLIRLAGWARDEGQLERSARLAREFIAVRQEIGDPVGLAAGLRSLADTLLYLGEFVEADALYDRVSAIFRDQGMRVQLAWAEDMSGWAKTNLGQHEDARARYQASSALFREMGLRPGIGLSLLGLGEMALVEGAFAEADELLAESVALFQETENRERLSLALAWSGHVACRQGELCRAQQCLKESLQLAAETKALAPALFASATTALFLLEKGEVERAMELYTMASSHPYIGKSRFWQDIVGDPIASAATTLPPQAVTEARERGRARELWATVNELLAEMKERQDTWHGA